MTCKDDTHVFLVGSLTCQCGVFASQPYPLSGGVIPGYTPNGFAPPRPPTAGQAPPVSIAVFRAAKNAGASHLSADGKTIYVIRMGKVCWADWSDEAGTFGGWWSTEAAEMPAGAVEM